MSTTTPKFSFVFYRFIGEGTTRSTEIVRDYSHADGMRGLVEQTPENIQLVNKRASQWADTKGITLTVREPFPSTKSPGKVWLEFRFGGLTL